MTTVIFSCHGQMPPIKQSQVIQLLMNAKLSKFRTIQMFLKSHLMNKMEKTNHVFVSRW